MPTRLAVRLALAAMLAIPSAFFLARDAGAAGAISRPEEPMAEASLLERAIRDIKAERFEAARGKLEKANAETPNNPDILNYLGFVSRKLGSLEAAQGYYDAALAIDPNHKGALEYSGELALMKNDPERARANLAKLEALCGTGCEEYETLKEAIAAYAAKDAGLRPRTRRVLTYF